MSDQNKKIKYDADYISYIEKGESAAVFITRDLAVDVPTDAMWVDVLSIDGKKLNNGRWDFKSFTVELFPRETKPVYPKEASDADKKYITWQTAHKDIDIQRGRGYKGIKYEVFPKLVNRNKGKYKIIKSVWNLSFEQWVPNRWFTSSCEWRERKIPIKAKWEYDIIKIREIK